MLRPRFARVSRLQLQAESDEQPPQTGSPAGCLRRRERVVERCAVADRLRAAGLPATQANIDAEFRALDAGAAEAAPPDPYALGLARLRTASEARMSTFEKQCKAERKAALAAEYADNAAHGDDSYRFATLSADELSKYAPPDPYAADTRKLQERRR
jgi:hypothetical protein